MRRSRQHRNGLGALVAVTATGLALALGGCADKAEEPTVASAATGTPAASAPTTTDAVAAYVTGMRKWVGCMRKAGVDLPDPNAQGEVDFGDLGARKADPTFLRGTQTCRPVQPDKPAELMPGAPALTDEQIANARAYAACMRANGVPTFRDPGPDGYPDPNATDGREDPAASRRAGQLCEPVLNGHPPATSFDPDRKGQG